MTGAILCFAALLSTLLATPKSLGHGIGITMAWGYAYGYLRANLQDTFTHFIFDAASFGCCVACLLLSKGPRLFESGVERWTLALMAWPALLIFYPADSLPIQVVGFRFAAFFLPFMMVGARGNAQTWTILANWLVALNLAALVMAALQYTYGLEPFIPRNATTKLLYESAVGAGIYRIPSLFSHAHGYGGTMVCSVPIILAAYIGQSVSPLKSLWLGAGLAAAVVGIVLSATRSNVVLLGVGLSLGLWLVGVGALRPRIVFPLAIAAIAAVFAISGLDQRLQRFRELEDTKMVQERVGNPLDLADRVVQTLEKYPLGNGLARAHGVSIPYFLQDASTKDREIVGGESEWVRLAATQGIVGVFLWLAFFVWVYARRPPADAFSCLAYGFTFAIALSGLASVGSMSAVPYAPLTFMMMGWLRRDVSARQA